MKTHVKLTDGELCELDGRCGAKTQVLVNAALERVGASVAAESLRNRKRWNRRSLKHAGRLTRVLTALNEARSSIGKLRIEDLEDEHLRPLMDVVMAINNANQDAWAFTAFRKPL